MRFWNKWSIFLCMLCCCACMHRHIIPSVEMRSHHATALAKTVGWHAYILHADGFAFKTYGPKPIPATTLTIYIEGDGLAWLSTDTPSTNPTPINPIGLKLAIHDKTHHPVVYLARACQYISGKNWETCRMADWTNARFSPAIIHATQQAIDALKLRYRAKKIRLVGYSGGGAIATLVAANRTDVIRLITIAGPLDTDAWTRQKNLTPLRGSLNPADAWTSLTTVKQTHWVGGNDTVIPKEVAFAYANRFPSGKKPTIKVVPTYSHACCWATHMNALNRRNSNETMER